MILEAEESMEADVLLEQVREDGKGNNNRSSSEEGDGESEDEGVLEERRALKERHVEEMENIEKEYANLKEKLYQQRLERIDKSLEKLKQGRLSRYRKQEVLAEEQRKRQMEIAGIRKKLELSNLKNGLEADRRSARDDFEERSRAFKAQMIAKLKRELKQAERDKAVMDVKIDVNTPRHRRMSTSQATPKLYKPVVLKKLVNCIFRQNRRGYDLSPRGSFDLASRKRRKQPFLTRNPYVVYQLAEGDILADLRLFNTPIYSRQSSTDITDSAYLQNLHKRDWHD
eukprot:m.51811 g.51811  ORF g.51811 m.51811 type:complete len:285 (-) comp10754_c0_seq2:1162-2016(-)